MKKRIALLLMLAGFTACSNLQSQDNRKVAYIEPFYAENIRQTQKITDELHASGKKNFQIEIVVPIYIFTQEVSSALLSGKYVDPTTLVASKDYEVIEVQLESEQIAKLANYSADELFFIISDKEITGEIKPKSAPTPKKQEETTDPKAVKI